MALAFAWTEMMVYTPFEHANTKSLSNDQSLATTAMEKKLSTIASQLIMKFVVKLMLNCSEHSNSHVQKQIYFYKLWNRLRLNA